MCFSVWAFYDSVVDFFNVSGFLFAYGIVFPFFLRNGVELVTLHIYNSFLELKDPKVSMHDWDVLSVTNEFNK